MSNIKDAYFIYTCGKCTVNPGGSGAAASIIFRNGESKQIVSTYFASNDYRMELIAMIQALKYIPKGSTAVLCVHSSEIFSCLGKNAPRSQEKDLWETYMLTACGIHVIPCLKIENVSQTYREQCEWICNVAMQSPCQRDGAYEDRVEEAQKQAKKEMVSKVLETSKNSKEENAFNADKADKPKHQVDAMLMTIEIPDEYVPRNKEYLSNRVYAERYHVHDKCASELNRFRLKSKHKLEDYASIQTDGKDFWSDKKPDEILKENSQKELLLQTIHQYLDNSDDAASAVRWYARGLELEAAIRKVLVDNKKIADIK